MDTIAITEIRQASDGPRTVAIPVDRIRFIVEPDGSHPDVGAIVHHDDPGTMPLYAAETVGQIRTAMALAGETRGGASDPLRDLVEQATRIHRAIEALEMTVRSVGGHA